MILKSVWSLVYITRRKKEKGRNYLSLSARHWTECFWSVLSFIPQTTLCGKYYQPWFYSWTNWCSGRLSNNVVFTEFEPIVVWLPSLYSFQHIKLPLSQRLFTARTWKPDGVQRRIKGRIAKCLKSGPLRLNMFSLCLLFRIMNTSSFYNKKRKEKVYRDELMLTFPHYLWEKHKLILWVGML